MATPLAECLAQYPTRKQEKYKQSLKSTTTKMAVTVKLVPWSCDSLYFELSSTNPLLHSAIYRQE